MIPLGFKAVTKYVLTNSFQLDALPSFLLIVVGLIPAINNFIPKNIKYRPPTHFTAWNQKADSANRTPNPSKDEQVL